MSANNKHIDLLIARFISGEISPQEEEKLNQWLNSSQENKKYFTDIQFINQKATTSHPLIEVDVNSAWEKVRSQMHRRVAPQTQAKKLTLKASTWLQVAAVVAIALGTWLAFYLLSAPEQLQIFEPIAIVSHDSIMKKSLADSSTVTLNRDTRIAYAEDYGQKERRITLEGEAFFEVEYKENIPFIVEARGTFIQDIGTSFNIKALDNDSIVEVYVKAGEVHFFTSNNRGINLIAGETGKYHIPSNTFTKLEAPNMNAAAYATRVFYFHNTKLSEVLRQLSLVYNAHFKLENEDLANLTLSVKFEDEELEFIMEIIAETLDIAISGEQTAYTISTKKDFTP